MNRNRLIILTIVLILILIGIWTYHKIDQFFKVDSCLDKGGRWNYETKECEFDSEKNIHILKSLTALKTFMLTSYNSLKK
jgi:hypothetical protein